jgi:glycosyltransferase involved in cell wall biosynthesis
MVVLSEPQWGGYPYIESIQSFLSVVDELVIAFNVYGKDDGSRAKIESLGNSKIRIVPTVFDILKYGWVSYGIARTMGYQACKGEIVLMFDADGILHEDNVRTLEAEIDDFTKSGQATGYWNKYRFYQATLYFNQYKHSGIYNKAILGDRFDFFRAGGKGAPNFERLSEKEQQSKKFPIFLFGYEHLWDTREVIEFKANRYGVMMDTLAERPIKTSEQYFADYMREMVDNFNNKKLEMPIEKHPKVIQEKLRSINETHFGYNFFGFQ